MLNEWNVLLLKLIFKIKTNLEKTLTHIVSEEKIVFITYIFLIKKFCKCNDRLLKMFNHHQIINCIS